jgi:hypothetical protein
MYVITWNKARQTIAALQHDCSDPNNCESCDINKLKILMLSVCGNYQRKKGVFRESPQPSAHVLVRIAGTGGNRSLCLCLHFKSSLAHIAYWLCVQGMSLFICYKIALSNFFGLYPTALTITIKIRAKHLLFIWIFFLFTIKTLAKHLLFIWIFFLFTIKTRAKHLLFIWMFLLFTQVDLYLLTVWFLDV